MPDYSTDLKTWGATGQEHPDGYNYVEGEQPVDAWDNFITHNIITDVNHLINVTNDELLAADGSVDIDNGATAIPFTEDAGAGETIFDFPVSGTPTGGTEQSVVAKIDSQQFMKYYAEADGAGGIQNPEIRFNQPVDVNGNDLVDESTTIWDTSKGAITGSIDDNVVGISAIDGSAGSADQAIITDGTNASWGTPPASVEASETNDLSDVTRYTAEAFGDTGDNTTLVDISGTSGVLLSGYQWSDDGIEDVEFTVDGGPTQSYNGFVEETATNNHHMVFPPIKFSSSLNINLRSSTDSSQKAEAWVKT